MANCDGMTDRRKGARGSGIWLALLLSVLLSVLPSFRRLSAQVSLQLSLGARYTSTMVHDSIVTPFDVRPAIAPVLAVSATTPLNDPWSAVATLDVSWSRLERHDQDGTTAGLGGLGALALTVGVARRLAPGLAADAAIGGLKYLPAADNGIFAGGTGGVTALGALGVSYALPLGGSTLRGLALRARYDIQRFLTPALRNEGFTSGEIVHRVALTLGWSVGQHGVGARP